MLELQLARLVDNISRKSVPYSTHDIRGAAPDRLNLVRSHVELQGVVHIVVPAGSAYISDSGKHIVG